MHHDRCWQPVLALLVGMAFAAPAVAQQADAPTPSPPPRSKPAAKPPHAPKPAVAAAGGAQPTLLGQYGEWGAYAASPGGKKVCFAIAKPVSSQTEPANRPRNAGYMFISSRPGEKVSNEISIMAGYAFKPNSEATAEVGPIIFALYTQQDGAWIKNAAEEAHMVEAMRSAQSVVIKGISTRGAKSTDTYSLKGLTQALARADQDCK